MKEEKQGNTLQQILDFELVYSQNSIEEKFEFSYIDRMQSSFQFLDYSDYCIH